MLFKAQKALHLYEDRDKKTPKSNGLQYAIFEKYDGWWGAKQVSVGGSDVTGIISRASRKIPSLEPLSRAINTRERETIRDSGLPDGYLIFEILVEGHEGDFPTTNGILNRKVPALGAYIMVHDFIPTNNPQMSFVDRYELAGSYVSFMNVARIKLAPVISIGNHLEIQRMAEEIWQRGGEGAIGKNVYGGYDYGKRNANCIKVKEELTLDLEVVGMYGGQGKYAGTLGGLKVRGQDGIIHSVSGMTDAQRDLWWNKPSLIVKQIVEVKAMKKLKDGSLREPRFKAVRHDKDVTEID